MKMYSQHYNNFIIYTPTLYTHFMIPCNCSSDQVLKGYLYYVWRIYNPLHSIQRKIECFEILQPKNPPCPVKLLPSITI